MSNSDSDSEGFKSADDNEFEDSEKLTEDKPKNGAKKNSDDKANVKNVSKSEEKPVREEKLKEDKKPKSAGSKLIEVRNDNKPSKSSETKLEDDNSNDNDFDDNWEWGDDEDANAINEQASDDKANEPEKHSELNVEIASNKEANEKQSPRVNTKFNNSLNNSQEPTTSWAPWSGVVSFLSTASDGVASFTSHVSSVIESNIGIPDPGEIAQRQRLLKKELSTEKPATESSVDETNNDGEQKQSQEREENSLSLGSFVSNVTQLSNRVISGGLDTLEGIGKKTMNILQENDPGLLNKRKLLGLDNTNPVLSQVQFPFPILIFYIRDINFICYFQILREAKEKSEEAEKNMKLAQKKTYKKTLHFETLFDDYHGLVHLEALEMLSKQATIRLQSLLMPLTGKALTELNDTLNEVKELCELNELEQEDSPDGAYESTELQDKLFTSIEDLDIPVDFSDILE